AGAVVAAGIAGRGGPLEAGLGFHCLALELACAAGAVAAGWAAVRRGVTALGGRLAAGAAAAGALAGDAGLHLVCRAQDSLPHLLVFHVGGVALVAVLAARLVRGLAPAE
ncbi:MAG TPA: hypothetical protein VML50_09450, partial [Anaeromyxobacter sp.]|nr:hypothetical protein [Anaeromyxobacter sp.]